MKAKIREELIGLALGDLERFAKPTKKNKSYIGIKYSNQSLPDLRQLHEIFRSLGINPIKSKKGYNQHYFRTKSSGDKELIELYRLFHDKNGKRILPKSISKVLTSWHSLARLYKDDGTLDYRPGDHYNASIATYNLPKKDCETLKRVFLKNFGLHTSVHKVTMRGKVYWKLYIKSESMGHFIKNISPYIGPCHLYKVDKEANLKHKHCAKTGIINIIPSNPNWDWRVQRLVKIYHAPFVFHGRTYACFAAFEKAIKHPEENLWRKGIEKMFGEKIQKTGIRIKRSEKGFVYDDSKKIPFKSSIARALIIEARLEQIKQNLKLQDALIACRGKTYRGVKIKVIRDFGHPTAPCESPLFGSEFVRVGIG